MTRYEAIPCASALHKLGRKMPYSYDLNIYKGCEHGCKYCYAAYSHPEGGVVQYKENLLEHLERELRSPSWEREIINIGGVTDSYQPCEKELALMPEILKLLIRYKTPAIISTKSDLPLRDIELIDELSRVNYINIAASIVSVDDALQASMEPGATLVRQRFAMLKEMRKTNASVGFHLMPIVPYLTDSPENFDQLFALAQDAGVHYMLPGAMYLRGASRGVFFSWLEKAYPAVYPQLRALYKSGGAGKEYKDHLYSDIVHPLRDKHGLNGGYAKIMKEKLRSYSTEQLSFL